jgi:hypothetical protein
LIAVLDSLGEDVNSVQEAQDRKELLQTSIAMRAILDENKDKATGLFRQTIAGRADHRNFRVMSVLAYGARGNSHELRVNATSILGYVVDNDTACVPIDHLYDPQINTEGRVNLLAVVSAFLPQADPQNLQNIKRLLTYTASQQIGPETSRIVDNLRTKTNSPAAATRALENCKAYTPLWDKADLKYE